MSSYSPDLTAPTAPTTDEGGEVEPTYQTVILSTTPDGWSRVVAFAKSDDSARRNLLVSSEGHRVGHVIAGSVQVGDALESDDRRWRGW